MVICMALMDGRMFGWRLPEARKGTDGDTGDEAEDIRPLHCVVHPILRVRLPPTAATAADSTAMAAGASSEAQLQEAAGPDASGTHPRRVPDLSSSVRLPTFLSPACAAGFTPLWHAMIRQKNLLYSHTPSQNNLSSCSKPFSCLHTVCGFMHASTSSPLWCSMAPVSWRSCYRAAFPCA